MSDQPKSKNFILGFETAQSEWEKHDEDPTFINPFTQGTDEWAGYEEAVYILTQK
jgi:hypothetical protein